MHDTHYTNGVIAVKEKALLGEKLLRLTEMSAEEAFRTLKESGFGGAAAQSAESGEQLCRAEEEVLDGFIRTYAPSQAICEYLLTPRDFHNVKALLKAKKLGTDAEKLLASDGLIPVAVLKEKVETSDFSGLCRELKEAAEQCEAEEEITGAQIGALFDRALYSRLFAVCRGRVTLFRLLSGKADRLNILTALRAQEEEFAKSCYIAGGKLKEAELSALFRGDSEWIKRTPYAKFYATAAAEKEKGKPFTQAERLLDSFEAEYFAAHRYELSGKEPFLYYVLRRRAEIANVRILLVCLNVGMNESDIKKRLRAL